MQSFMCVCAFFLSFFCFQIFIYAFESTAFQENHQYSFLIWRISYNTICFKQNICAAGHTYDVAGQQLGQPCRSHWVHVTFLFIPHPYESSLQEQNVWIIECLPILRLVLILISNRTNKKMNYIYVIKPWCLLYIYIYAASQSIR